MQESSLNWKQIIITAVITGVIAIVTGMILFFLQRSEPKLTYSLLDTIPFEGHEETLAIQHIILENEGNKLVENVSFFLNVSPSKIKKHRISGASALKITESVKDDSYWVNFENLNPNEAVTISILTTSIEPNLEKPEVALRGKGILGSEATTEKEEKFELLNSPVFAAAFSGYSVLVVLLLMRKRRAYPFAKMGKIFDSDTHSDDQNEVMAYLFNIHGLPHIAEDYLKRHRIPSYWSESDYIATLAIQDKDQELIEIRKKVLIDLLEYASVAPSSKGIIHYNIARVAQYQGNIEEKNSHIEQANKLIPKLIKTRMKLDPLFKNET